MIRFKREGTNVRCVVDCVVPNDTARHFYFDWDCRSEIHAGLLSAEMQKQLNDELEAIRRAAYEQGWKDAKAKNPKRQYFRLGWSA